MFEQEKTLPRCAGSEHDLKKEHVDHVFCITSDKRTLFNTVYKLKLDDNKVRKHQEKIDWMNFEDGGVSDIGLFVDEDEYQENAHFLIQWSLEFDIQAYYHQIDLPEFEGYGVDVGLCLDMMRGHTVMMQFYQSITILKFATRFSIPEIVECIENWFKSIVTDDNLIYIFDVIVSNRVLADSYDYKNTFKHRVIYDYEHVYDIGRRFIIKNPDSVLTLISNNWDDFRQGMINLLIFNHTIMKIIIPFILEHLSRDFHYDVLINRVNYLYQSNDFGFFFIYFESTQLLLGTIVDKVTWDMEVIRKCTKLMGTILKRHRLQDVLELPEATIVEHRIWRELLPTEYFRLKQHTDLDITDVNMNMDYLVARVISIDPGSTVPILNTIQQSLNSGRFELHKIYVLIGDAVDFFFLKDRYHLGNETTTQQTLDIINYSLDMFSTQTEFQFHFNIQFQNTFVSDQFADVVVKIAEYLFERCYIRDPDTTCQIVPIIKQILSCASFEPCQLIEIIDMSTDYLFTKGNIWNDSDRSYLVNERPFDVEKSFLIIEQMLCSATFDTSQLLISIDKALDYIFNKENIWDPDKNQETKDFLNILLKHVTLQQCQLNIITKKVVDCLFSRNQPKDKIEYLTNAENNNLMNMLQIFLDSMAFDMKEIAQTIKTSFKNLRPLLRISSQVWNMIPTEDMELYELRELEPWKYGFGKENILKLLSYPKHEQFFCIEIMLAWINSVEPEQETIVELWNSIKQDQIEYWYMWYIRRHLTEVLEYDIPPVKKLDSYKFTSMRYWSRITQQHWDKLSDSEESKLGWGLELTWTCGVQNCKYYDSYRSQHIVTLKMKTCGYNCELLVIPTRKNITFDKVHFHETSSYLHFYLIDWDSREFCSLFTNKYYNVSKFINKGSNIYMDCLMFFEKDTLVELEVNRPVEKDTPENLPPAPSPSSNDLVDDEPVDIPVEEGKTSKKKPFFKRLFSRNNK